MQLSWSWKFLVVEYFELKMVIELMKFLLKKKFDFLVVEVQELKKNCRLKEKVCCCWKWVEQR